MSDADPARDGRPAIVRRLDPDDVALEVASDAVEDALEEVGVTARVADLARQFARHLNFHGIASRHAPTTLAASCVYLAAGLTTDHRWLSQATIAEAAGCTQWAIQNSYRNVARVLDADDVGDPDASLRSVYEPGRVDATVATTWADRKPATDGGRP